MQPPGGTLGQRCGRPRLCPDVKSRRPVQAAITTMAEGEWLDRFATEAGEVALADQADPYSYE